MPELPEVETIRRTLTETVVGRRVKRIAVTRPKLLYKTSKQALTRYLVGQEVRRVARRAKYLIFHFGNGKVLVSHLGMSGKFLFYDVPPSAEKHTHLFIDFDDGTALRYVDKRYFGRLALVASDRLSEFNLLAEIGPEVGKKGFSLNYLRDKLRRRRSLKDLLTDQKLISGIGNIYASEILFRSGLSPLRLGDSLSDEEIAELCEQCKSVIAQAVRQRGSHVSDYVDAYNRTGRYQAFHRVYAREGEPCFICNTPVERIKQKGRSTFFCPVCQR